MLAYRVLVSALKVQTSAPVLDADTEKVSCPVTVSLYSPHHRTDPKKSNQFYHRFKSLLLRNSVRFGSARLCCLSLSHSAGTLTVNGPH